MDRVWKDPMCGCARSPDATGLCPTHGNADWYRPNWYFKSIIYSVAYAVWHRVDRGFRFSKRCKLLDRIDTFIVTGCEDNIPQNHPWAEDVIF
jgi:hypothetical protein